jgi:hypothetical protein
MESPWQGEESTECRNCGKIIPARVRLIKKGPRKGKKIEKGFCNDKCRADYHNAPKTKIRGFVKDVQDLLKRNEVWGKVSIAFELIVKEYHFD